MEIVKRSENPDRMDEAKRNLEKIIKKIEPFIKKKKTSKYSTTGRWNYSS